MMGGSMIKGLITSKTYDASSVIAADICDVRLQELSTALPGLKTTQTNEDVAGCDVVVLGIEPKDVPHVCGQLAGSKAIFVSLAAGVTLKSLAEWLPAGARIVRVMPNTPCTVGEMAAGYSTNDQCSVADGALVGSMLGALGSALKVVTGRIGLRVPHVPVASCWHVTEGH